jgi:hypothetical protein
VKFIEREHIDIERWDALVKGTPGSSIFSLSVYLDNTAERWCILVDEEYTRGIALPYVVRLGIKLCYTPIFVRYLEWFGLPMDDHRFMVELKHYFPSGRIQTKHKVRTRKLKRRIYQQIDATVSPEVNSQTKRMLNKYDRSEITLAWEEDIPLVMKYIRSELPLKVTSLDKKSLDRLESLVTALNENGMLRVLVAKDGDRGVGGLFAIPFNGSLLYLKGAMAKDPKEMGVMYGAMQMAIESAQTEGLNFDFGGSNAEGVKRFNYNLGGEDKKYYVVDWDHTPGWYRFIMKVRNVWKRKRSL